jgi:hypothetical protein
MGALATVRQVKASKIVNCSTPPRVPSCYALRGIAPLKIAKPDALQSLDVGGLPESAMSICGERSVFPAQWLLI